MSFFTDVIQRGNFVVLDTETTGLQVAEICQIAIVGVDGDVLMDTLVKPVGRIPPDATRIHGITNADVSDAPRYSDIHQQIYDILNGRDVIVYNASYDRKMLHLSAQACGLPKTDWKAISHWHCAMEAFSEIYGERSGYGRGYRFQKLSTAARYYHVPQPVAHTALADCLTTLAVCKAMLAAR